MEVLLCGRRRRLTENAASVVKSVRNSFLVEDEVLLVPTRPADAEIWPGGRPGLLRAGSVRIEDRR
jgi:hypothetical protein